MSVELRSGMMLFKRFLSLDFNPDDSAKLNGNVIRKAESSSTWSARRKMSSDDRETAVNANNAVRQKLLDALKEQFGGSFETLPAGVKKALKGTHAMTAAGDFGFDKNGNVKSGRPLTMRRIRAVVEAVEAEVKNAVDASTNDKSSGVKAASSEVLEFDTELDSETKKRYASGDLTEEDIKSLNKYPFQTDTIVKVKIPQDVKLVGRDIEKCNTQDVRNGTDNRQELQGFKNYYVRNFVYKIDDKEMSPSKNASEEVKNKETKEMGEAMKLFFGDDVELMRVLDRYMESALTNIEQAHALHKNNVTLYPLNASNETKQKFSVSKNKVKEVGVKSSYHVEFSKEVKGITMYACGGRLYQLKDAFVDKNSGFYKLSLSFDIANWTDGRIAVTVGSDPTVEFQSPKNAFKFMQNM